MGKFKKVKKPFEGKRRRAWNKRDQKTFCNSLKTTLDEYNSNQSWFNQNEALWNENEADGCELSASRRKIVLPEEDVDFDSGSGESESDTDSEEVLEENLQPLLRNIILDPMLLQQYAQENVVCKYCFSNVKFYEDVNQCQGQGTKLLFRCMNNTCSNNTRNGFYSTEKTDGKNQYQINNLVVLGMRAIGKGRSAAQKLFSIINLGSVVSKPTWAKTSATLCENTHQVADRNMKHAGSEVRKILNTTDDQEKIINSGTSFDCSWNSRGWQAKEGVVAAISQENGKIVDIVQKTSYCRECKYKQISRDKNDISSLEYMEWFMEHEPNCLLNHTGSPQVRNSLLPTTSFRLLLLLFDNGRSPGNEVDYCQNKQGLLKLL